MENESTDSAPMIDFEAIWQTLTEQAFLFGPKILFAIAILIIGNWIAKMISNAVRRGLEKRKVEPSLVGFVGSLIHAALVAFRGDRGVEQSRHPDDLFCSNSRCSRPCYLLSASRFAFQFCGGSIDYHIQTVSGRRLRRGRRR